MSRAIKIAIADAVERNCIGTASPGMLEISYEASAEAALESGQSEAEIIEALNALQP